MNFKIKALMHMPQVRTVGDFSVRSQVHLQISYSTISRRSSDIFLPKFQGILSGIRFSINLIFSGKSFAVSEKSQCVANCDVSRDRHRDEGQIH